MSSRLKARERRDEDEDEALAKGAGAVPLHLLRLVGTHPQRHLRTRVQPRIPCKQQIPGQAASQHQIWPRGSATGRQGLVATHLLKLLSNALRLQAPTALGSPSTPLHILLYHGLTTDAWTMSYNACVSR